MSGVLVDSCIWSLALRGDTPKNIDIAEQLSQLIDENTVRIIGAIRQEVLSGYSNKNSFENLRKKLSYFPNEEIIDSDYEAAAEYSNFCRTKGIQGSHIDYLICAVAVRTKLNIYTVDKDFLFYSKHLPISLFV
ncbi:type II toxin-antitoxin system VapC family toxin [Leucothrix pacifica]|uniref:PIN domain nuclease n=1 Tax=Leucothrix pacifica TaxID=1247513 RepID=A0A317CCH3_9GAMM|nr:PIN domain-containing protein [Leucothrix pacifica]PWQ95043.1 PIN domain nuclease [Leucothrix pacifica]